MPFFSLDFFRHFFKYIINWLISIYLKWGRFTKLWFSKTLNNMKIYICWFTFFFFFFWSFWDWPPLSYNWTCSCHHFNHQHYRLSFTSYLFLITYLFSYHSTHTSISIFIHATFMPGSILLSITQYSKPYNMDGFTTHSCKTFL